MSNYDKSFIREIIRGRAVARRKRAKERATNEEARRVFVPFEEWLKFVKGCSDWRQLKPYRRWDYFNEYQLDCLSCRLEYSNPRLYNIYDPLFD